MDDASPPQKATPNRRRQGRHPGKSSSQKAYASENDAPQLAVSRQSKTPRTPSKHNLISPIPTSVPSYATSSQGGSQGGSKSRSKNAKPKPKTLPTSPDHRNSSPKAISSAALSSGPSTAFAGATFHASPAPSALPKPSFVSRSSDESPLPRREATHDQSPPATDTDMPTRHRSNSATRENESPLDFMFRAHREEKLRQTASAKKLPDSVEVASPPWSAEARYQVSSLQQARAPTTFKRANQFIDNFEWGNGSSEPMGPAFSTPYQDRIKAARNTKSRPLPGQDASRQLPETPSEDPTEALKRYLFDRHPPSSSGSSKPIAAPSQPVGSGASVPKSQTDPKAFSRANNLLVMENDLRRMLNLEVDSDASSAERRLTNR